MKIALVLAGLCAVALATPVEQGFVHGRDVPFTTADKQHFEWQKNILRLFKYVNQPTYYKDHVEVAKSYSIKTNIKHYSNPEAVEEFLYYYHHDILPRDHIFSVFNQVHLKQAIALFKVFYYAKDFDTLYKTAVWARNHVNQGLFLYSFSVALLHHPATYGITLPPIYEVYPYYFYNSEVIFKAQQYKQRYGHKSQSHQQDGFPGYTIYANYSGYYLNVHPEQSLSYFIEDVGINAFYYYYNLYHPFWLDYDEVFVNSISRGAEHYYFYHQFLARVYLERLSDDFGEIPQFDYEHALETGYTPSLVYPNGLAFPERPNWVQFGQNFYNHGQSYSFKTVYGYSYDLLRAYENRIFNVIDTGFIKTESGKILNLYDPEGFNTLGNIIEANPESANARFFGHIQIFARHLLGYAKLPLDDYHVAPSALEHFETSLRDPVFYQLYKRIILFFQTYKSYLPHYTHDELDFAGVKIESVHVDQLVTYFESVDADITNAVYVDEQEFETEPFHVRVRQQRLNHKPFAYKVEVVSEKPVEAVVRTFIGPKYDEYGRHIDIEENRVNFVEFDTFRYSLKAGKNVIERNSHQTYFSKDYPTYKHLLQQVDEAITSHKGYDVFGPEFQYTFPSRYLLPKGRRGGQTYQFYVIVSKYKPIAEQSQHQYKEFKEHQQTYHQKCYQQQGQEPKQVQYYPVVGLGVPKVDSYPLGYPFDRPIQRKATFYVPNSYFKDVVIYHKHVSEINSSQPQDYESSHHYSDNQNYAYYHPHA